MLRFSSRHTFSMRYNATMELARVLLADHMGNDRAIFQRNHWAWLSLKKAWFLLCLDEEAPTATGSMSYGILCHKHMN